MKQIVTESPLLTSGDMMASVMGIDIKNIAHITKVLRDSIYTDKILAVVREILSNSLDEHDSHSIQRPVETGIRKEDAGEVFFARDFAKGLDENGIRNVFSMYGNSTKSNDNKCRGAWGLGGKSPFAYSDSFFVVSHHNGVKTSYSLMLGGDDKGASTGYVYKVDEQATSESGIEITVPIKTLTDAEKFWNNIVNFVSLSPSSIKANWGQRVCQPAKTIASKSVSGYSLRIIESPDSRSSIKLQMGGVTYQELPKTVGNSKVKDGHCLVIDIPIGTCTVPVSRESFEATEKNEKILREIDSLLNTLATEDLSQFKTKTVLDLVTDSLSAMTAYQGDFFQTSASNLYKNVWKFVEETRIHNPLLPAEQKNGKPICVIIPNNDARNYWREKVKNYLRDSARNVYMVTEGSWNSGDLAITDSFELVSARKLPYPKIPKINGRFAVYERTRRRTASIGKFNAIEFFNYASNKFNWKFTATTEKEVYDFISKKVSEVNSNDKLHEVSFSVSDLGCDCHFSINSAAFSDKLESSGFIVARGDIWRDIFKKLEAVRQESAQKNQIFSSAKKEFVTYLPKTTEAIKKVRHADRVGKFWSAILKENSLRGKILQQFNKRYSYDCVKINRQELRKILALK